jgi:hypothetical protein
LFFCFLRIFFCVCPSCCQQCCICCNNRNNAVMSSTVEMDCSSHSSGSDSTHITWYNNNHSNVCYSSNSNEINTSKHI